MDQKQTGKTFIYSMDADVALLFYELCNEFQLDSEPERLGLLNYLAEKGLMHSISVTGRSKEQVIADYKKNFDVLDLTKKKDTDSI